MQLLNKITKFGYAFLITFAAMGAAANVHSGDEVAAFKSRNQRPHTPIGAIEDGYTRPDEVPEDLWNSLVPYFLPADSPEKAILDEIFMPRNLLRSHNLFLTARFKVLSAPKHKIMVATHPKLKGYVIKAFLEKSKISESPWWLKRIRGANAIREKIIEYGYEGIMKVPHKWIYPLPHFHPDAHGDHPKYFILIAENMDIQPSEQNKRSYLKEMDEEKLDALVRLVIELKLEESVYYFNTPFSQDGRLTFVDTEFALEDCRKINFKILERALSPDMKLYLRELIAAGGIAVSDDPDTGLEEPADDGSGDDQEVEYGMEQGDEEEEEAIEPVIAS